MQDAEKPMPPWERPTAVPALVGGAVHVWRFQLPDTAASVVPMADLLSEAERDRAHRFRRQADRLRFTAGRGLLRILAGSYLDQPPAALSIALGERGKPCLENALLHFNLSHGHDTVVLAFARDRAVGIDIERLESRRVNERFVRRYFSPEEQAQWRTLSETERITAFFRGWTRKEAYLKAQGKGITMPLEQITVSLGPEARLCGVDWDPEACRRWSMVDLPLGDGYAGALASRGAPASITYWDAPALLTPPEA